MHGQGGVVGGRAARWAAGFARNSSSAASIFARPAAGRRSTPLAPGEDVMHGDLRDPAVVDRLLQGVDVLIHLAGTSVERPLPEIMENNLRGLHEVYEGARRHGVGRVVFASSNHAFGMNSVDDRLTLDAPFRPDGLYGLSKAWGEAHGPDVLGQARDRGRSPCASAARSSARPSSGTSALGSAWRTWSSCMMRCIEARGRRLPGGLGRLRQHAQLLGAQRLRAPRLPPEAERGGLRGGDPAAAEPARLRPRNGSRAAAS